MRTNLRDALKSALAARDRTAAAALRSALGAIDNAEAVPADQPRPHDTDGTDGTDGEHIAGGAAGLGAAEAARRELTEAQMRSIVETETQERLSAADEYERLGRRDHADRLRSEAAVLQRHLTTTH